MAKKANKLVIILIVFVVVIVGAVALLSLANQSQPIVNSLAFGYLKEDGSYQRFFYKEIYMTGSEDDIMTFKILVNESTEHSTTEINWGSFNSSIVEITKGENEYYLKPKAEGEVKLTVQSAENLAAMDTCVISIKQKTLSDISVEKINDVPVGDDNILNIYCIDEEQDNNCYNRVYLNLHEGNASALTILKYDESKIEDIYIDPTTFSLQIKTKQVLGKTSVKLGWRELDSNGVEHIVGQTDFIFNICEYKITGIGFDIFETSDFSKEATELVGTNSNYKVYLGTDAIGNNYKLLYARPYYIYSSGWENRALEIGLKEPNAVCSTYVVGQGESAKTYYIINMQTTSNDVNLVFTNNEYAMTIEGTLKIVYCNGTFVSYFG